MAVTWRSEACDLGNDPETGAFVTRLTQAAKHSINIYGEQPYTSPDGKRIAIMRSPEADPRLPPYDLYVIDLQTLRIHVADRDVQSIMLATSAWSGLLYYLSASRDLVRLDIATLERQIVWSSWPFSPEFMIESVSPDHRYLAGVLPQASYDTGLVRVDLQEKTWKVLLERPELFGGHVQYAHRPGSDGKHWMMGFMIRGKKLNQHWHMVNYEIENPGNAYYLIDNDGNNFQRFPACHPLFPGGHSAWIGDTGRIAFNGGWNTMTWQLDPRWPQGNLFIAEAGKDEPRVFAMPDQRINHVSVSRCGRFFICDSYPKPIPGPTAIVIGNFETGKYRNILNDCKATSGGAACSHAHPYMTGDNRHIIYNADPFLLGQVHMARVPDGFLESLS